MLCTNGDVITGCSAGGLELKLVGDAVLSITQDAKMVPFQFISACLGGLRASWWRA